MAKQKQNFLLRDKYEAWLKKTGRVSTDESMNCYVMGDEYAPEIKWFELIAYFMLNGEPSYAYSLINKWRDVISKSSNSSNKTSYLSATEDFFKANESSLLPDMNSRAIIIPQDIANEMSNFRKSIKKSEIASIDSMDILINALGGIDKFVKYTVESSFFFDPNIVADRFNQIANIWSRGGDLNMRGDSIPFGIPQGLNILKDSNGNSDPNSVINKYTGYNLNVTLDVKPIVNSILSHVWGQASDPRYFTALWNIALIPAWANHLMDKPYDKGSLASRLQSTVRAICVKLYDMDKFNWKSIGINSAPTVKNVSDIVKGTYTIRIISPVEEDGAKVGQIKKVNITL